MTREEKQKRALRKIKNLIRRRRVVDLKQLQRTIDSSGRTVFRLLNRLGYLSSYSHAGRYYTLGHIATFSAQGLWFYGEARFSKHGTLRATVVVLVREAPAGHTHEELQVTVGLRVHDTLRSLVADRILGRERVDTVYVYVDANPERTAVQLEQRRRMRGAPSTAAGVDPRSPPLDLARVVDVLLAVIREPRAGAERVATALRRRGLGVSDAQVEEVFRRYELEKKTARSRWRPWRR